VERTPGNGIRSEGVDAKAKKGKDKSLSRRRSFRARRRRLEEGKGGKEEIICFQRGRKTGLSRLGQDAEGEKRIYHQVR